MTLELNGQRINESRDLQLKIAQTVPGTTVRLKIFRDSREREVSVTLGELRAEPQRASESAEHSKALEGVSVDEVTPQIARQLGLPARRRGVVVVEVQPGSVAADAGLRRGDVIQEVNRKPITSVAEFERAVAQAGNQPMLLLVNRGGNTLYIAIESR